MSKQACLLGLVLRCDSTLHADVCLFGLIEREAWPSVSLVMGTVMIDSLQKLLLPDRHQDTLSVLILLLLTISARYAISVSME